MKFQCTQDFTVHCGVEVKKFLAYIKLSMQENIINCSHSMTSYSECGNLRLLYLNSYLRMQLGGFSREPRRLRVTAIAYFDRIRL